MKKFLTIDKFALRQFSSDYSGTKVPISVQEFQQHIDQLNIGEEQLKPGYAPFCKHVFVRNFAKCETSYLQITSENEHLLKTGYEQRTEKELPVLGRWFPKANVSHLISEAEWLDVILYSREQIKLENDSMKNENDPADDEIPWGIISIKAQDVDHELPMQPITMLRNALGREYGGSGAPLHHDKYLSSVKYWSEHAIIQ
jgi:hypothetical protein